MIIARDCSTRYLKLSEIDIFCALHSYYQFCSKCLHSCILHVSMQAQNKKRLQAYMNCTPTCICFNCLLKYECMNCMPTCKHELYASVHAWIVYLQVTSMYTVDCVLTCMDELYAYMYVWICLQAMYELFAYILVYLYCYLHVWTVWFICVYELYASCMHEMYAYMHV
jgi:hypothetical protein